MKVKVVGTQLTTNSAGQPVEAVPLLLRPAEVQDAGGSWVDPVPVTLDDVGGVPARVVTTPVVTDLAGKPVTAVVANGSIGVTAPLQLVGTKMGVPSGGEGDGLSGDLTHQAATSRHAHLMPAYDVLVEEVHYDNWRINPSSGAETDGPATVTYKSALEPDGAGAVTTMANGGNRSVAVAGGAKVVFAPSAPLSVPGSSILRTRQRVSVAVAGEQWPVGRIAHGTVYPTLGESDNQFGAGAGTDQVDAIGTFGDSVAAYSVGPSAILGRPADGVPRPSVMIIGDSLQGPSGSDGGPNYGNANGNYGFLERWIDNKVAFMNCARSGHRMQWFAQAHTKTFAYLAYCSHLIIAYGANDWSTGRTAAQMLTDLATLITDAKAVNPAIIIVVMTSLPKVTATTNAYVDGGSAIAVTNNGYRETYNTTIRDPAERAARGIHILLDPAVNVEDNAAGAGRVGFFKPSSPALTTDGTHLTATGMALATTGFGDPLEVLALRA